MGKFTRKVQKNISSKNSVMNLLHDISAASVNHPASTCKEINLKFQCECSQGFIEKTFKSWREQEQGNNVSYLASLTEWYRSTLEKQMDEKGIKDNTAYVLEIGKDKAASGVGSIIYIEAIKGTKGYITVEYDGPTFTAAGLSFNDQLMATMHFMSQSVIA